MPRSEPAMTAAQLRQLLEAAGQSQQWLAEKLAVDKGTVNRWANGRQVIGKAMAIAIKSVLK